MSALVRLLFLAPLGHVLGIAAAIVVLHYSVSGDVGHYLPSREWWPVAIPFAIMFVTGSSVLFCLPGLIVIIMGEIFSLRSSVYWLAAGGLIGLLPPLVPPAIAPFVGEIPPRLEFSLLAVPAGLAWGLVYWLIAGRLAGRGFSRDLPPGSA